METETCEQTLNTVGEGEGGLNWEGQNTGVGSLSLLQGIFPTQGLIELGSSALQTDSLPTELSGKPIYVTIKT